MAIGIQVVNKTQPTSVCAALFDSGIYDLLTMPMVVELGGRTENPLQRMGESCLYGVIAPQWRMWIDSKGEKGEEPPESVKQMVKIREEAICEPDEQKRIASTLKIFKILEENLWTVGGMTEPQEGRSVLVSNRLGNVPRDGIHIEWLYSTPAQYYFKK